MRRNFSKVGIIGKFSDRTIARTLDRLFHYFRSKNFEVFIDDQSSQFVSNLNVKSYSVENMGKHCDIVIAAGGDGTFLTVARAIAPYQIPMIGVNLGRLGFLVDISPDELLSKLDDIFNGKYNEEHRYILKAKIIRNDTVIHQQTAVNEVVIHRWVTPSMIEIVTRINGVFLNSQRSDGLIVSTPTGSTAYSLSAGGPILHPSLKALVLVPLNPHTLSNRPIVVDDSVEIEISFCQTKQINALVTCDHLEIPEVLISDKILITKEPKPITILHPIGHDFYHILRKKLHWSSNYTDSSLC